MAISKSKTDKEWGSLIESTSTAGQPARAVVNPDGSSIGSIGGSAATAADAEAGVER